MLRRPIGFAHRGASAHAPENTLEAFTLALRLGATGLESDVWLTADGVPVLVHDGTLRSGLRRRAVGGMLRGELPSAVPALDDLYAACGNDFDLSLDIKDAAAAAVVVARARAAGGEASGRLWLCHPDWEQVAQWRALDDDVKLVDSTRLRRLREGPERRAATLAEVGIDAVNMHQTDWTGGLTTLFHRFERLCLAWDAQFDRVLASVLAMGVDGVFSDHVDRMMAAIEETDR